MKTETESTTPWPQDPKESPWATLLVEGLDPSGVHSLLSDPDEVAQTLAAASLCGVIGLATLSLRDYRSGPSASDWETLRRAAECAEALAVMAAGNSCKAMQTWAEEKIAAERAGEEHERRRR